MQATQVPPEHALRHALLHPPTPDELYQHSNSNNRSTLLRIRAETSQWELIYVGILGVTQYLYSMRLKKLDVTRSSRRARFAGFFLLNVMQTALFTNMLFLTPIQAAQDINLFREVYF